MLDEPATAGQNAGRLAYNDASRGLILKLKHATGCSWCRCSHRLWVRSLRWPLIGLWLSPSPTPLAVSEAAL